MRVYRNVAPSWYWLAGFFLLIGFGSMLIGQRTAIWGQATLPTASAGAEAIAQAWQLAQRLGRYHFTTQVEQQHYPAPRLANVGRPPQIDYVYGEGQVDLAANQLQMTLWQQRGNAVAKAGGVELKVENGRSYLRQPQGEWQEVAQSNPFYAPANDPLAFLRAVKNVTVVQTPPHPSPDWGGSNDLVENIAVRPPNGECFTNIIK